MGEEEMISGWGGSYSLNSNDAVDAAEHWKSKAIYYQSILHDTEMRFEDLRREIEAWHKVYGCPALAKEGEWTCSCGKYNRPKTRLEEFLEGRG
jgi:hypothetical protein